MVSDDQRVFCYGTFDDRQDSMLFDLTDHLGEHSPTTLHHTKDRGLVRCTQTTFAAIMSASVIRLIEFYHAMQAAALRHQAAYELGHAPRCLVCRTKVSLQLSSGDAVLALAEQVQGVEPGYQRGGRFMEDRTCSRRHRPMTAGTDEAFAARWLIPETATGADTMIQ